MRAPILLLVSLLCLSPVFAQRNETDSLRKRLTYDISEKERIAVLLDLSKAELEADPVGALEHAHQASQLATKIDSDSLFAYACLYQGNTFLHSGSYPQALQFYVSVIPGAIERSDSLLLAIAYANMGNVYYFQGDHENALKHDTLSLEYFSKNTKDQSRLIKKASLLSNIGSIYDEIREFDKAKKYYDDSYALALALNDHEVLGNVLNNRGTLYRDQGMDSLALRYYLEALQLRENHGNRFGMARSNFSVGLYYFNHSQYNLATRHLSRSVELGKQVGAWQTVSSAAEFLYKSLREEGHHAQALNAFELFMQTRDSLYNEQNTRKIAQLEMQFEFDKKQKQIEADQKEKELYYLLAASALLLLFLTAIILFLIQKNKVRKAQIREARMELERAKLKNDLETKDKELATNVMFLLEKNELINGISEKLMSIKSAMPSQAQGGLQKVILDLQSNVQNDLWQELEFRFQRVFENFYRILTERFPELSPSEKRLCALLKLNMTTKEISALTHQNSKSIEVARTRLRKKLGLTGSEQNLVTFLEQLDGAQAI